MAHTTWKKAALLSLLLMTPSVAKDWESDHPNYVDAQERARETQRENERRAQESLREKQREQQDQINQDLNH
jgi:hypothetical protein